MGSLYKDVTRLLSANGFSHLRSAKGSHEIWSSSETGKKLTVPRNLRSRHTANAILKSANIEKKL
ncbi:MAG: type II toxin-antitoxin system HicA family toxin [Pseudomonadota bacterium]